MPVHLSGFLSNCLCICLHTLTLLVTSELYSVRMWHAWSSTFRWPQHWPPCDLVSLGAPIRALWCFVLFKKALSLCFPFSAKLGMQTCWCFAFSLCCKIRFVLDQKVVLWVWRLTLKVTCDTAHTVACLCVASVPQNVTVNIRCHIRMWCFVLPGVSQCHIFIK